MAKWFDRRIGAQMARNSRPHTPAEVSWNIRHARACDQTNRERSRLFPVITPENFNAVNAWQTARIAKLTQEGQ